MKVLLQTGKETMLTKAVYTDKELAAILGSRLKSQMVSCDDVLWTNKLEKVMKMVISLEELDNSDNLEDGQPSNTYLHIMLLAQIFYAFGTSNASM